MARFTHFSARSLLALVVFVLVHQADARQFDCAWDEALQQLKTISSSSLTDVVEFDDVGGTHLYVGGDFDSSTGDVPLLGIARWDGKHWQPVGGGLHKGSAAGAASVLCIHDDGQGGGPALYVGGDFDKAGDVPASNIAKWDGKNWSALGTGSSSIVRDMLSSTLLNGSPTLIATGSYTSGTTSKVGLWNGATWSALGTMTSGSLHALEFFDDGGGQKLYLGGNFNTSSLAPVQRWTGTTWQNVGGPFVNTNPGYGIPYVTDLVTFNDGTGTYLHASGTFNKIGNVNCWYIARWNGAQWSAMGVGFDAPVLTLETSGSGISGELPMLYAGGYFKSVANFPDVWSHVHGVARWNGTSWTSLGDGVSGAPQSPVVSHMEFVHDPQTKAMKLLVGGNFLNAGQTIVDGLAMWDGANWDAFATPLLAQPASLYALNTFNNEIYATGNFRYSGDERLNFIARWDGESWHSLGEGLNGYSYVEGASMTVCDLGEGPELFVVGVFESAGAVPCDNIARWNGTDWNAVPADFPVGSWIDSIASTTSPVLGGPAVFITGKFSTISGQTANHVAKWDGKSWSSLGTGLESQFYSPRGEQVIVNDDDADVVALYLLGEGFETAGGVPTGWIAGWNGSAWFPLPELYLKESLSTFHDGVNRKLVAYGAFGPPYVEGIGIRENGVWNLIGELPEFATGARELLERKGLPGQPSHLYVGGKFANINGVPANNLARWDGSQWSEVGGGSTRTVRDMTWGPGQTLYTAFSSSSNEPETPLVLRLNCPATPGDIAPLGGNGIVDVDDLLAVINSWGPCDDPENCAADIAPETIGNGVVDVDDLLMVINNWDG